MPTSEARIVANRLNAQKSTGPRTVEGKERSRLNAYKHGMAGRGVALPEADARQMDERFELLAGDLKPKSATGVLMIQVMAVAAVQMERAARHEADSLAMRARHAVDDFDESRYDQVDRLFDALAENPRTNLRRLKKMPEGVERLIHGWDDLRAELMRESKAYWTPAHLARAVAMTGARLDDLESLRLVALARAARGDFSGLAEPEGGDLDEEARRAWARGRLLERVEAEVAALEEHYDTLDFETLELDRAEAPGRSLFDDSKAATLARRYESAAARRFFRAMAEFRRAEAEAAAKAEASQARPPAPKPVESGPSLASNRVPAPPPAFEPGRPAREGVHPAESVARTAEGSPLAVGRPPESRR